MTYFNRNPLNVKTKGARRPHSTRKCTTGFAKDFVIWKGMGSSLSSTFFQRLKRLYNQFAFGKKITGSHSPFNHAAVDIQPLTVEWNLLEEGLCLKE